MTTDTLHFDEGDIVRLTATFSSAPTDGVTFVVKRGERPGQNVSSYVYGTDPEVVQDSSLVYHLDYTVVQTGGLGFRVKGTGDGVDLSTFTVAKTNVVAVANGSFHVGGYSIVRVGGPSNGGSNLDAGDTLRVDATFTDESVTTDPGAVTLAMCTLGIGGFTPDRDVTYTYGSSAEVTRLGTGLYRFDIPIIQVGVHSFRVRGTNVPDVAIVAGRLGDAAVGHATTTVGACSRASGVQVSADGDVSGTFIGPTGPQGPSGAPAAVTVYRSGAGTHVYATPGRPAEVILVGGGAGGGGAEGVAAQCAVGGGGGSGALIKLRIAEAPASSAYSVGAGGAGGPGGSIGAGVAGGDTAFHDGSVTRTAGGANGGNRGLAGTTPSISQSGPGGLMLETVGGTVEYAMRGATGEPGVRLDANFGYGGAGGNSPLGGGGGHQVYGGNGSVAGVGPGAGGGGGRTNSATDRDGGAGADGIVIVIEYP